MGTTSSHHGRKRLEVFRALPCELAVRDAQALMAYPFFALAKSKRTAPIDYDAGGVSVRVDGSVEHGIATIWDADVLIWATSQIVEARDAGIGISRRLCGTSYEMLRFMGRSTALRDYLRLKAALSRLANDPCRDLDRAGDQAAAASLRLAQRVDGVCRCGGTSARGGPRAVWNEH